MPNGSRSQKSQSSRSITTRSFKPLSNGSKPKFATNRSASNSCPPSLPSPNCNTSTKPFSKPLSTNETSAKKFSASVSWSRSKKNNSPVATAQPNSSVSTQTNTPNSKNAASILNFSDNKCLHYDQPKHTSANSQRNSRDL